MTSRINLEYRYSLSRRARRIAEVMAEFDGIRKDKLKQELSNREDYSPEDIERPVRLLRMSNNVEVKEGKAYVKDREVTCQGVGINPLNHWKREAMRENESNLAKLKEKRES